MKREGKFRTITSRSKSTSSCGGNALSENIRMVEDAESQGKRFCPVCGTKMKTCCDIHRQYNLLNHRPNGVHEGPEQWVCLSCGLIEYKDLAMRITCGRAGTLWQNRPEQ